MTPSINVYIVPKFNFLEVLMRAHVVPYLVHLYENEPLVVLKTILSEIAERGLRANVVYKSSVKVYSIEKTLREVRGDIVLIRASRKPPIPAYDIVIGMSENIGVFVGLRLPFCGDKSPSSFIGYREFCVPKLLLNRLIENLAANPEQYSIGVAQRQLLAIGRVVVAIPKSWPQGSKLVELRQSLIAAKGVCCMTDDILILANRRVTNRSAQAIGIAVKPHLLRP